jgi:hypothetical protein
VPPLLILDLSWLACRDFWALHVIVTAASTLHAVCGILALASPTAMSNDSFM